MDEQHNEKTQGKRVKIGDTILLHYTSKSEDGSVIETTKETNTPIKLTLGEGLIHKALEVTIVGMSEGDSKQVSLPANRAYGPYRNELVFVVDRDKFKDVEPKTGDYYKVRSTKGDSLKVRVTEIKEKKIKLDGNHSLAGKDISYNLELVQIVE